MSKRKLRVLAESGGRKWDEVSSDSFFLRPLPKQRSPAKGASWKMGKGQCWREPLWRIVRTIDSVNIGLSLSVEDLI